ncbi:ras-like GTP-binding protein RHO [Xenia sp. Carnegie-2017]|uniref:ras-like GTP-binding protein RHO n=1 Tax=Xenia sp. Carnegie-2017 TaxID=2897299 RepID=UPI001F03DC45|nr:ras-like GTP-binding protein RHO [Xenia sp. Carnegie-2017]
MTKDIVIVGDGMSGKTSAIKVYLGKQFPSKYMPTICESHTKKVRLNGRPISLQLWDTAVQEDIEVFRPMLYRKASVFIVMYSIDRPESLENVYEKWTPELRNYCPNVPIILVGNKMDRRQLSSAHGQRWSKNDEVPVSSSTGREIARKINAFAYKECSALSGEGVKEIFQVALQATQERKGQDPWKRLKDAMIPKACNKANKSLACEKKKITTETHSRN